MNEPEEAGSRAAEEAEGRRRLSSSEAELVADLKPAGALERMMIQQMARAHDTTMACFDRAEQAVETTEAPGAREVELRLAARFMTLFMQQIGALERRRVQARQAAADETAEGETAKGETAEGETAKGETAPAPPREATARLSRHERRALAKRQRKARKRLAEAAEGPWGASAPSAAAIATQPGGSNPASAGGM